MALINLANVEPQGDYKVIPDNTVAKVRLQIKQGFYNDKELGFTDGCATKSDKTNSVYLKTEYEVIEGKFKGRKIFGIIGLHSPKGPEFKEMGLRFMRTIVDSSHGLSKSDTSNEANTKRSMESYKDLHFMEFAALITVSQDHNGKDRNEIKRAITVDDARYESVMGRAIAQSAKAITNEELNDDEIPF